MDEIIKSQRVFFNSDKTKPADFRIKQLKKLKNSLKENEKLLFSSIDKDFSKSEFETYMTELGVLYAEIDYNIRHVQSWMSKKVVETDFHNIGANSFIHPEPLGIALIIGAWNYPYLLSLGPVVAAMASGNCITLKPSELPVNTSNALCKIISENFDKDYFNVIEGGVETTTMLLKQKFDKIFFTGSTKVGKIIYKSAAENLTPVTLELGGKSPAIIDKKCNLKKSVQRLVWGKYLNAGQTCVAPDYALVHEEILADFLTQIKAEIKKAAYKLENDNYVQIINDNNFKRLVDLIDGDKIYCGGGYNKENRTIEPTVLSPLNFDDTIMQDEIFGPILPVIPYSNLDEIINKLKSLDKPLACYVFSQRKKVKQRILNELSFGGGCINDSIMHLSSPSLPFGGVGASGIGSYHGEEGFRCFTHYKSILNKTTCFEPNLKYSPRTKLKLKRIKRIM